MTDGDTHWTMIHCALSSPITGGLGLEPRRLAQCLTTLILCPGRTPNRSQRPHPHLLLPALFRKRRRKSRSKSCRWLGNSIVEVHREDHPTLVHEIRNTQPGTLRDLHSDRVDPAALANLCVNLGIMTNRLVQQHTNDSDLQFLQFRNVKKTTCKVHMMVL